MMAGKSFPFFKAICESYLFNSERITCSRFSILKRDIKTWKGFLRSFGQATFFKTFKVLGKAAFYMIGGYYIYVGLNEDESVRKAKNLKSADYRGTFNFIADVVEVAADAVVHVRSVEKAWIFEKHRGGSGFIIKSDGFIITNAHVVGNENGRNVKVTLRNGKTFAGVVKAVDEFVDLALIHINDKNLPVLKLGSANNLRPGEWVAAIGSPLFLTNSVTVGVVSSVHRRASELGFPNRNINYIQTDAAIICGNSGGPLLNLDGEVIGVNTMTSSPGISFAIPVEYVKEFFEKHKRNTSLYASVERKFYIGVWYLTLSPSLLSQFRQNGVKLPNYVQNGLYIWKVERDSPAFSSGLRSGDVIHEVEGRPVFDLKSLYEALKTKQTVTVKFFRDGIYYSTNLTPKRK